MKPKTEARTRPGSSTKAVMENRVRRALVSVFDKEGVVELCKVLASMGVEILSSGGTARLLDEHGIDVTPVPDYTGFPEMLDAIAQQFEAAAVYGVRTPAEATLRAIQRIRIIQAWNSSN